MKKMVLWAILLLAPLMIAAEASGAIISWNLPTAYADGSPIDPKDVAKIVVEVYSGPTEKGPWKAVATSLPGATSVTVPDPPSWQTYWFTVKSTLQGGESEFAVPVRQFKLSIPFIPKMKMIAKKILAMKKEMILSFLVLLVLLAGLVGLLLYRRYRGKG